SEVEAGVGAGAGASAARLKEEEAVAAAERLWAERLLTQFPESYALACDVQPLLLKFTLLPDTVCQLIAGYALPVPLLHAAPNADDGGVGPRRRDYGHRGRSGSETMPARPAHKWGAQLQFYQPVTMTARHGTTSSRTVQLFANGTAIQRSENLTS